MPTGRVDCTRHVLRVLDSLRLDALIPIGGDDTLSFASRLHDAGSRIVAIPKTMDNDVFGTDYCVGFSTAVTRSVDAITAFDLGRPPRTHRHRGAVRPQLGADLAYSAYLANVDRRPPRRSRSIRSASRVFC